MQYILDNMMLIICLTHNISDVLPTPTQVILDVLEYGGKWRWIIFDMVMVCLELPIMASEI